MDLNLDVNDVHNLLIGLALYELVDLNMSAQSRAIGTLCLALYELVDLNSLFISHLFSVAV